MAEGKKNARRLGAHLVFIDESGFLLSPSVYKTWAPRGRTPVHRHFYRHDRISVISAVSISPQRKRVGLYYKLHFHNIRQHDVCEFLRYVLRHLRGRVVVLWDGARIHKGEPIRDLCGRFRRLRLELFPPYAPELNPDEGVWLATKRELANGCPFGIGQLKQDLLRSLRRLRCIPAALRACINKSELPLFCLECCIIYAALDKNGLWESPDHRHDEWQND